ncbi:helix-turn-helix domain-containing protein [Sulfolobus acidocaldarius]|uniref:Conserved Crenarchaeal protein n=4 Tax=Sulfolobus acidocaldarius TaxID=2285 RepID=Q4J8Q4_SULAC|nr:helix-turn-helix transcriptional regulator [Sulfolobus acidocaldarius]AAY80826.1 conserved Crenarchaeal protein [Sulfolobus acidocaldarius DSM 639]AGE71426.1 hypothetical protein SacN8_07310 [Sulfolobus acidocaldarius N8]AGE73699.1 hypothetical protein SacRon12I_07320 [Sulfolobus acidocaldarius Ron12/I]ALU30332.1 XRE family transcriptional regulator [Sulfolobus acidocaldarius]ALU31050.1 XRE family transcriptional regulator [Sulfolobus acidocaldarius]
MRIIHNLSKDARAKIIEILLENRSKKELAEELEISPAAVTKFVNGITHPSDDTIEKAIEIADDEEKREILNIIIDDIMISVEELVNEYKLVDKKVEKIKKILNTITYP